MALCDSCSPKRWCSVDKNRTECKFYQPMTNEEWIKSANTEQLAEVLNGISLESLFAGQMHDLPKRNGTKAWVEWLKQPHTDKE